jgi:uncharacterized membrane protein
VVSIAVAERPAGQTRATGGRAKWLSDRIHRAIVRLYIDSTWPHWVQCHRLPERSFHSRGRQLHLCARCTGLSVGGALAVLLAPFLVLNPVWVVGAVAILVIDGATQMAGLRTSTNPLRFATGVAAGFAVCIAVLGFIVRGGWS